MTLTQIFSCEFCKIFKGTYFVKHLRTSSSERLWCNIVLLYPCSIEIWKNLIKRTWFIKTWSFLILECSFHFNDNFRNVLNHISMVRPFCRFSIIDCYLKHGLLRVRYILMSQSHSCCQGVWTILYSSYTSFWTPFQKFHSKQSCYYML